MFKLTVFCVLVFASGICRCKNILKNEKLDKCKTPDSKDGKCILLEECASLLNNTNDLESPMSLERLNHLISSQCGFKDTLPKVCCPLEEVKDQVVDICKTPDSKEGKCVLLEDCPAIYKDANDLISPMTLDRLNFLIGSQCGFRKSYPKVCCVSQNKRSATLEAKDIR